MKPEPLTNGLLVDEKEKTLKIVSQRFWLDLKERVKELLKEIKKEQEKLKEQYKKARKNTQRTWIGGAIGGLEIAEDLIKKAFNGVIEE